MSDDDFVIEYMEMINAEMSDEENETLQLRSNTLNNSRAYTRTYKYRDRAEGARKRYHDYVSNNSTYNPTDFRRRFRMNRNLFNRILDEIQSFLQRPDATGKLGLTGQQKMTAAIRMLAYEQPADAIDEYICIGETTVIQTLRKFCQTVYRVFGPRYLREPTAEDIRHLTLENSAKGFLGMLGSVDCMQRPWKNCPTGWQRQYIGHAHVPTIILEAVVSYDTWIWHAFFGMPGSNNDLNVLQKPTLFQNLLQGIAPPVNFTINNHEYNMGYYLADGIYPPLSTIVQAYKAPNSEKKHRFTRLQEGQRKDVERAFGILQSRFAIVAGPTRFWDPVMINLVMMTYVILHNMIVEDELRDPSWLPIYEQRNSIELAEFSRGLNERYDELRRLLTDKTAYNQLRMDLVQHQWKMHGAE